MAAELCSERALPAQVVHKDAIEQVFVTDWMLGPGEDWCTIAAQLPLAHARFSDTAAPYHDILLVAETVRQAGLVIAEEILKLEGDRQFLLRSLQVELDPLERARKRRGACELLISQDSTSTVKMRPGRTMVGGMMHARLTIGGHRAGVCEVTGAWVPEGFYAGLRRAGGTAASTTTASRPAASTGVELRTGKVNPANSVLTPLRRSRPQSAYEASLVVEPDDPTFFDHELDHVPGLYLLAGMQQVAVAGACTQASIDHSRVLVRGMQVQFSRFAEFVPEVICSVALDERCGSGEVSCVQGDTLCCGGSVRLAHV